MPYKNAIFENGNNRITEDGLNRIYEDSTAQQSSDFGASITILQPSQDVDLGASITVMNGLSDLGAKITVAQSTTEDLGASVVVQVGGADDFGASINIIAHEELGGSISVSRPGVDNLTASVIVQQDAIQDLGAKIKLVEYSFRSALAKINVLPHEELDAKITIPRNEDLGAKISIPVLEDLGATVNIPPGLDLSATVNVLGKQASDVGASIYVFNASDLGATVSVVAYGKLDASLIVTTDHQKFGAKINVGYKQTSDLGATIRVHGDLRGKITVIRDADADLGANITVEKADSSDIGGSVDITPYSEFGAKIGVFAVRDIGASIDVSEDKPDDVVVTADVTEATWQNNDNPVFDWVDPDDPFYTISEFYVAWNKDPDYTVTAADQLVTGNSIDKTALDADKWYFHIRAVNTINHWSENTTHFAVWFNNVPNTIGVPLLTEGLASPTIYTVAPELSWGNATDSDQQDVIVYNVNISTDVGFTSVIRDIDSIAQGGVGSRTEYTLSGLENLDSAGQYFWRVRASDGKQYGAWSGTASFVVAVTTTDVGASLTVPTPAINNFGATINVIGHKELNASISVFTELMSELGATINVSYLADTELGAKITMFSNEDFGARISVSPYINLGARANVVGVVGDSDFGATINVGRKSDAEFGATVNVKYGGSSDFGAFITIPKVDDISATMVIYTSEHFGFIDDFSENFGATINVGQSGYKNLGGSVTTIADRPGSVVITANVPEAIWQQEKDINFEWTSTSANFLDIDSYYIQIDTSPSTVADDSFQRNDTFSSSYDLEILGGADIYYFHVAAKAVNNMWGPTSHYAVYYNHRVPNPSVPMTVNNNDSIAQFVMVSVNNTLDFEWGQSIDQDSLDVVTYTVQIATQEDFGVNELDESSIIYEQDGIPSFTHSVSGGAISSGTYYWRVMSNDGHQDSAGWSPTGRFYMNTPPSVPIDLIVYD